MTFTSFIHRVQRGLSTVELIHTSHPRWPLPPGRPHLSPTVQISVLDSSFNLLTLAHLVLANTLPPSPPTGGVTPVTHPFLDDFDARLLLLSVRNADKQLKPGDATYEQRMEMMVLLAQDLARTHSRDLHAAQSTTLESTTHESNVAVAIIDEPTFVGKSSLLLDFLRKRVSDLSVITSSPESPSLYSEPEPPHPSSPSSWVWTRSSASSRRATTPEEAMKTALHRFLSPTEDDSRIICTRRISKGVSREEEEKAEILRPDFVRDIAPADQISFVDIG